MEFISVDLQVEKMTSHDPLQKEMATEKKEGRKAQAELEKLEAREHNAAAKQTEKGGAHTGYPTTGTETTGTHTTTGATGHPTGTHQMSAMPGHGTEQPTGRVIERTEETRIDPGLGRTTAHNAHVEGTGPTYGTGGH